jgi:hypothetical protein
MLVSDHWSLTRSEKLSNEKKIRFLNKHKVFNMKSVMMQSTGVYSLNTTRIRKMSLILLLTE